MNNFHSHLLANSLSTNNLSTNNSSPQTDRWKNSRRNRRDFRWLAIGIARCLQAVLLVLSVQAFVFAGDASENHRWLVLSSFSGAVPMGELRETASLVTVNNTVANNEMATPYYGSSVVSPSVVSPKKTKVPTVSPAEQAELAAIHQRLTYRYGNPKTVRFLRALSANKGLQLYREISELIDRRHLKPVAYDKRVSLAIRSLSVAVTHREFLQANGLKPTQQQVQNFRAALNRLLSTQSVRTRNDAVNMLYWSMGAANRQLGLRGAAAAMEFIHAATDSLDKYSAFVPNDPAKQPSASLEDHVVGIGVEIKPISDGVIVIRPLRGGPAAKAGLLKGDVIVAVNGRSLAGHDINFAASLIAGPAGSSVRLDVRRSGRLLMPVMLTRQRVTLHSVSEARLLPGEAKIGYVKLDTFTKSSTTEVEQALWNLHRQGMQTLVFDLRGNPGGLLTTAIELSNKFLPRGTIVSTRGRTREDNSLERATYSKTWKLPLVVLVDENSASASEIFAAAIQENRRGLVVGRKSYGKGTVQTHFPLQTVSGNLRLTTARFYSPKGRKMAGSGVTPDVLLALPVVRHQVNKPLATNSSVGNGTTHGDRILEKAKEIAISSRVRQLAIGQSGSSRQLISLSR